MWTEASSRPKSDDLEDTEVISDEGGEAQCICIQLEPGRHVVFYGIFRGFHRTKYVTLGALEPLRPRPLRKTDATGVAV